MELTVIFGFKLTLAIMYIIIVGLGIDALCKNEKEFSWQTEILRGVISGIVTLGGIVVFYYLFKIG